MHLRNKRDRIPHFATISPFQLPAVLPLGANGRCHCGKSSTQDLPTRVQSCTILYPERTVQHQIEAQRCSCRSRGRQWTVGPDLREFGLFNWDNETILAHSLLNDFGNQLLATSYTCEAFKKTTEARWREVHDQTSFPAKTTFLKILHNFWILQKVDTEFRCPKCGDQTIDSIWDAQGSRHLQD
jgi:CxC4 like cysteine cluster associated with KDZ transposases